MSAKPSTKETLSLIRQMGVRNAVLRYADEYGNFKEMMLSIDLLTEDMWEEGIKVNDTEPSAKLPLVVYPEKQSSFLVPFQDNPTLTFNCSLARPSSSSTVLPPPTKDPSSSLLTSSPSNFLSSGTLHPRFLMFSPANGEFSFPNNIATPNFSMIMQPPLPPPASSSTSGKMPPPTFLKMGGIMMTPLSPVKMPAPAPPPLPLNSMHNTAMDMETDHRDDRGEDISPTRNGGTRKHQGTSCHQCKNARAHDQLAFCHNAFNKRTGGDKRQCRKKFCSTCLKKFYQDSLEASKMPQWTCPSCRGICTCAACARVTKRETSPGNSNMDDEYYDEEPQQNHHVEHELPSHIPYYPPPPAPYPSLMEHPPLPFNSLMMSPYHPPPLPRPPFPLMHMDPFHQQPSTKKRLSGSDKAPKKNKKGISPAKRGRPPKKHVDDNMEDDSD